MSDDKPDPRDLLAHDIRSALSDVIGGLRLIDSKTLPSAACTQVNRVHAASELLARLVEELLGGNGHADEPSYMGNLNLTRFLDDELRRWHGAAQGTGTRVKLERPSSLPEVVRLDLLRLRRVVANLMSNALRHAPGGEVVLGAELYGDATLSICVTDDGPGFPDDLLEDATQPAARGAASVGAGMGLHIAAANAEALGGMLKLVNRPKGGARAILTIPQAVWQRREEETVDLPDLSGTHILVADDNVTNQTLVRAMLERMGAECEVAKDGIEALNWLSRERFDLALIDVEMPMLGGMEVFRAERLRQARGMAPPLPMVAMTAYGGRDNNEAIVEAGADGILAKPLGKIDAFGKAMRHYLDTGPRALNWVPETEPHMSAFMLLELLQAAGPDYEQQLLDRLREDLAQSDTVLTDALENGNVDEVRAQTHILLSLTSAIGAIPTQEAAKRLNQLARSGDEDAMRVAGKICLARLTALRVDLASATFG